MEQVAEYNYLGCWITEDGRCEKELFWQRKHSCNTKNYWEAIWKYQGRKNAWSCGDRSTKYGPEQKWVDAFEQDCYRRIMKISWTDTMRNDDVFQLVKEDHLQCKKRFVEQKSSYAEYTLRGSSGNIILLILQHFRKETDRAAKKNVDGWHLWAHNQEDLCRSEKTGSWHRNIENMIITHRPSN